MGRYGSSYYDEDRRSSKKTAELWTRVAQILIGGLIAMLSRCESKADVARKPTLVDGMVNNSINVCRVVSKENPKHSYEERLRYVLKDTFSQSMDTLNKQGINVCLDMRLKDQKTGFFGKDIIGIYYPGIKQVSLYDNGSSATAWFSRAVGDRGRDSLEDLAEKIDAGEIDVSKTWYAATYSCGKNCTEVRWKSQDDFDQSTLEKNPELASPPGAPVPIKIETRFELPFRRPRTEYQVGLPQEAYIG
jgi:hypothetical protein